MLWVALLILIYSYLEAQFVSVRRDTLFVKGLPPSFERFTIVHLSDLHCSGFGAREKRLCRILQQLNAELVVFTGDYKVRKSSNERNVAETLRPITGCIRPTFGTLGILGNKDNPRTAEGVEKAGIEILSGKVKRLSLGGDVLWIAGIDSLPLRRIAGALPSVTSLMPREGFRILLSHGPDVMPLARALGYSLVLCGDTHGGQIRLPFIGALMVKSRISRRYCHGLISEGDTVLCVSSGIGTSAFPLRLLCPPEVRILTLTAKNDRSGKEKRLTPRNAGLSGPFPTGWRERRDTAVCRHGRH